MLLSAIAKKAGYSKSFATISAFPFDELSSIVQVVPGNAEKDLASKLVTRVPLKPGQVLFALKGLTLGKKRYTTVQVSKDEHVELNSDLVYMNHSCEPTLIVDVTHRVICVAKELNPGDELTFFYPSTEWEMDQPFPCWCGSEKVSDR